MLVRIPKFSSERSPFRERFLPDVAPNGSTEVGDSDGATDFHLPAVALARQRNLATSSSLVDRPFEGRCQRDWTSFVVTQSRQYTLGLLFEQLNPGGTHFDA